MLCQLLLRRYTPAGVRLSNYRFRPEAGDLTGRGEVVDMSKFR